MAFSTPFRLGSRVRFVPKLSAVPKLQVTPAMIEAMRQRAQAAAEAAIQVWHSSGPHPYETGDYVGSIKAEAGVDRGIAKGRVNAHDFKAWWLEFGTTDTPAFAPLRRGAEESGLHVSGKDVRYSR